MKKKKALLKYIDGCKEVIEIPSAQDSVGVISVPMTVELDDIYFSLDKEQKNPVFYEYSEVGNLNIH